MMNRHSIHKPAAAIGWEPVTQVLTICTIVAMLLLSSCERNNSGAKNEGTGHVDLAPYMSQLQIYSQKLGYAIRGQDSPLAGFYVDEIDEVQQNIRKKVPKYEGIPVARNMQMIAPSIASTRRSIDNGDWPNALKSYRTMIQSCNACHLASSRSFIVIEPADGEPPFNQAFEANKSSGSTDSQ